MNENWQKKFNRDNRVGIDDVLVGISTGVVLVTIYWGSMQIRNHYSVRDNPPHVYQTNYHGGLK